MSDNKDTVLAFVLGGLVGALVGILYAPKSGKEIRCNIKKLGEEIVDTVSNLSSDFKENEFCEEEVCEKVLSGKKENIKETFEEGKRAFDKSNKKEKE
ncbi:MAG: YtxH domain-containing protein [Endomicrobium sp.]|nr:YtxH domain-containing protein [Endomicrobium sp.]